MIHEQELNNITNRLNSMQNFVTKLKSTSYRISMPLDGKM